MSLTTVVALSMLALQGEAPAEEPKMFTFTAAGAGAYQFESDLDNGGDFSVLRTGGDVGGEFRLSPTLRLGLVAGYGFDDYDFSESTSLGADPWDDIHRLNFSGNLAWDFADRWTVYGGALVNFSGEDAEWSDSATGGGLAAVSYRINDQLTLGGGLGVVSRIEDDEQFFPVIIVSWQISDLIRVGTTTRPTIPSATSRGGIELLFTPNDAWEFAIGGRYDVRRFRLDDEGVAPDGVGEDESLPLWFRAGYRINDNVRLDAFAGVTAFGEMTLDDENGDEIANDDHDPAPFVGGSVSIRF